QLATTSADDQHGLGPTYRALETDFEQLERDLDWAREILAITGEPLHPAIAEELLQLGPTARALDERINALTKRWTAIADLFEPLWHQHLDEEFAVSID